MSVALFSAIPVRRSLRLDFYSPGALPATGKNATLRDLISFGAERRVGRGVKIYPSAFGTLICLEHVDRCSHCRCMRHCFVRESEGEPLRCLICAIHEGETKALGPLG